MKLRSLGYALVLASVVMSGQALAGDKHKGKHKPQPFKGCYEIVGGSLIESPAEDQESVGTYELVLMPQDARGRGKGKRIEISGPMAGREEPGGHEEGEHEEGEEEEIHGKHWFGTFDRSGVFITSETGAVVTGVGCIDPVTGRPGLIYGYEILEFLRGTGAFSGLTGGEVIFDGYVDRCTDPNNIVTIFEEVSGEMCFQE
jgi:hypothetical protein